MATSLQQLKQLFPSALYSYFRVLNFRTALREFLEDPTQNPEFHYHDLLKPEYVSARHQELQAALHDTSVPEARSFLERRLLETETLGMFLGLRPDQADAYRQQMEKLYGPLSPEIFAGAMTYLGDVADRLDRKQLLEQVKDKVSWEPMALYQPAPKTFEHYQNQLKKLFPELYATVPADYDSEIEITKALEVTGLASQGWVAKLKGHGTGILISAQRKVVAIGDGFHPRSSKRLQQVIAHEVYGHALRTEFGSWRGCADEEEGLAVAMEQLVLPRFYYKRVMRYLALCLAWGVDGTPRDFKDTYAVLRPIAEIICGDSEAAKIIAFRECVRAFRGGNPSIPGAILIKDKVYLEGNLAVWQKLEEKLLDAENFKAVIQGHATILERNEYDK